MRLLTSIRARLTYANVTATLALFIALGGSGYAAISLPRNSVGSREIRARAVGHAELAPSAVRSDNVSDGSLGLDDFSATARAALRGATGPQGAPGPKGADGSPGPAGLQGPRGNEGSPGAGVTKYWSVVSSGGQRDAGTATSVSHIATGQYVVTFTDPVYSCAYSATLAGVPFPGMVDVKDDDGAVDVNTYNKLGNAEDKGFDLIVVC